MGKSKKAQVTLFVIIAIIMVSLVAIVFFVKPLPKGIPGEISKEDIILVESSVEDCMGRLGILGTNIASIQGGYIYDMDHYLSDSSFNVAYWYHEGQDISPTLDEIGKEISILVNDFLPLCIDFNHFDFNVTSEKPTTDVLIGDDFIVIKVIYPITIIKGDSTYRIKEFEKKFETKLKEVYGIAGNIVNEQKEHPELVCLTCLADIGEENNMLIEVGSKEESLIVRINDEESKLYEEPYQFNFAMEI